MEILERFRKEAGRFIIDGFFKGLSSTVKLAPMARPEAHGVELLSDISYGDPGAEHHLLDIYRPMRRTGPLPVVLYLHGGGFRILSKDSHWIMGLMFARRGYIVFNINYRLAPKHPFPAALQDACKAFTWVTRNASRFGGSLDKGWILAGESAGANLATVLTICSCTRRSEPWAHEIFEADRPPHAVIASCGILQVSDSERFFRRKKIPRWVADRLEEVSTSYLKNYRPENGAQNTLELADPLVILEKDTPMERPLPPFFAAVGTADPLLDDTRRLKRALDRRNTTCLARYFPGEPHAFNAFVWRKQARLCWRETYDFLSWALGEKGSPH